MRVVSGREHTAGQRVQHRVSRAGIARVAVVALGLTFACWSTLDAVVRWRVAQAQRLAASDVGLARLERAEDRLRAASHLAPSQAGLHVQIGTVASMRYRWHGDVEAYEDAVSAFERAVTLNRWSPASWTAYGDALVRMDRPADAVVRYLAALDLDPRNASIHARLGLAREALGDVDGAREAYDRAQEILSTREVARLIDALDDAGPP